MMNFHIIYSIVFLFQTGHSSLLTTEVDSTSVGSSWASVGSIASMKRYIYEKRLSIWNGGAQYDSLSIMRGDFNDMTHIEVRIHGMLPSKAWKVHILRRKDFFILFMFLSGC